MGGRFTLSDDSHGIEQVGLNYAKTLNCVKKAGIDQIWYIAPTSDTVSQNDHRFPGIGWKSVGIADLERHTFWHR